MYYVTRHQHLHPFGAFHHLGQWMQELQRATAPQVTADVSQASSMPLNIKSNAQEAVVTAELPGIDPKTIAITVDGEALTITQQPPTTDKEVNAIRQNNSRTVYLPFAIDSNTTEAHFQHGLLTIKVFALARTPQKTITVTAA
jgi:HSP20 family protein